MKLFFVSILFTSIISLQESFGQVGIIDSTFGVNGSTTSFPWAWHIAVQTDDNILIAFIRSANGINENNFGLCRFKSTGKVDSAFGINGRATGAGNDPDADKGCDGMALQADGKIIVSNSGLYYDSFIISRYNSNGFIDQSFGINGFSKTTWGNFIRFPTIEIQTDGKIIAGGEGHIVGSGSTTDFILIRYNTDGSLDNSFGNAGKVKTHFSRPRSILVDLAIQQDGKIVAVGHTSDTTSGIYGYAIARYNSNGSLDNSFGVGGKMEAFPGLNPLYGSFSSVIILPDDKILVSGEYWSGGTDGYALIMKLKTNGTVASSFGSNGIILEDFDLINPSGNNYYDILVQPDNKIVGVGFLHYNTNDEYDFAMARYNSNGTIDSTFALNGQFVDSLNGLYPTAVAIQSTGKIVTANGWVFRFLNDTFLGILDFEEANNSLLVYPNPIQSHATLHYSLNQEEKISIELYDIQGELVQLFITNETRATGKHEEILKLNELLPAGNYIISIGNGKNSQGVKVVKE